MKMGEDSVESIKEMFAVGSCIYFTTGYWFFMIL